MEKDDYNQNKKLSFIQMLALGYLVVEAMVGSLGGTTLIRKINALKKKQARKDLLNQYLVKTPHTNIYKLYHLFDQYKDVLDNPNETFTNKIQLEDINKIIENFNQIDLKNVPVAEVLQIFYESLLIEKSSVDKNNTLSLAILEKVPPTNYEQALSSIIRVGSEDLIHKLLELQPYKKNLMQCGYANTESELYIFVAKEAIFQKNANLLYSILKDNKVQQALNTPISDGILTMRPANELYKSCIVHNAINCLDVLVQNNITAQDMAKEIKNGVYTGTKTNKNANKNADKQAIIDKINSISFKDKLATDLTSGKKDKLENRSKI